MEFWAKAVGGCVVSAALLAAAHPASADARRLGDGDVTCRGGRLTAFFEPAVGLGTMDTRSNFTGTLSDCVSTSNPELSSARFTASVSGPAGCFEGFKYGEGTFTITWNTGARSIVDISFTGTPLASFQAQGSVRSGELKGGSFRLVGQVTNQIGSIGSCLTGNLSTASGAIRQTVIEGGGSDLPPCTVTAPGARGRGCPKHPA
jgi:hypothetical protein